MPRTIVPADQLDLDSPGRRDYWVELEHDSIWGVHLIPLTVMIGSEVEEGRGLVAFGGNHGNEYEGPIALKKLLREIRVEDVRGRLIVVPVLNPAAFRTGTRASDGDDGVNLNRAFVEGAGETAALGSITHRIAAFVREHIWPRVHVVIDLHAGGQVARYARSVAYHPMADAELLAAAEETARWFGTPLIGFYQDRTPGLLPSEAERLGKITVGGEFGWGESVSAEGVHYARHGVLAAAIHHRQLAGTIEKAGHHAAGTQTLIEAIDPACFVTAPYAGHYEPLLECGEAVTAGQVVALLHDFGRIDEDPLEVRAGVDGVVWAQAWGASVTQGQHVLVVGKVLSVG